MGDQPNTSPRPADFLSAVSQVVGERYGAGWLDPDGTVGAVVIDLTDADRDSITAAAEQAGLADRFRLERADPAHVAMWQDLSRELDVLWERPSPLMSAPSRTGGNYRRPPCAIELKAHAESVAADLHRRYGDFVKLRVGALPYPTATYDETGPRGREEARQPADPALLSFELDGELTVASGHSLTHGLLVANHGPEPIRVVTNRTITAEIVDPATGAKVGGYAGRQIMPRAVLTIAPSATQAIPLLVGTDCYVRSLGYAVPPGRWAVVAPLRLEGPTRAEHVVVASPPLPFTITP